MDILFYVVITRKGEFIGAGHDAESLSKDVRQHNPQQFVDGSLVIWAYNKHGVVGVVPADLIVYGSQSSEPIWRY